MKNESKAQAARMVRRAKKLFGDFPSEQRGLYTHVHLDGVDAAVQKQRVETFRAELFFDTNCPHCRPFLEEGAFIVYTGSETTAARLLPDGMFETVLLRDDAVAAGGVGALLEMKKANMSQPM